MIDDRKKEHSSFRDKSGFIFYDKGNVYRAVHHSYKEQYEALITTGLSESLIQEGLLVKHRELEKDKWPLLPALTDTSSIYKVLQPEKVHYVSYPYEWCFQQLKDAALLTLQIQLKALGRNMTLKDASGFNVQFINGKPVFIDTLSFERYEEGQPWVAYRQFCTHFLAPLAIMSHVTPDLRRLSQLFIDGVPLAITSKLLPLKSRLNLFLFLHVHQHAKLEAKYSGDSKIPGKIKYKLSRARQIAIINHLISGISSLKLHSKKTEWSDYYQEFSYSDVSIENKKSLIKEWVSSIAPQTTWDLGSNTGLFSELVQPFSKHVIAFDIDHLAIEKFYARLKTKEFQNILPLVLDLSNPSPAIGWANKERKSFTARGTASLILALALIHHLSIANNVPFIEVAETLSKSTEWLIIEFVPKQDQQTQRLLVTRKDIFDDYNQPSFETAFGNYFTIEKKHTIVGTERTLYLMRCK